MDKERVVDGLGGFSMVGGIVRFELLSLKTLEGDLSSREAMEVSERLAMSLQTFLNFYQGLTHVVSNLESKGVISRNPESAAVVASASSDAVTTTSKTSKK